MSQHALVQFHNRRKTQGVSETIATIVLIVVTVIIGTVAAVWANGSSVASQNGIGGAAENVVSAAAERFQIVSANFSYTPSKVSVWIYDSGNNNATVTIIYVNNVPFYNNATNPCTGPGNNWLVPHSALQQVKLTLSCPGGSVSQNTPVLLKAVGYYGFVYSYPVEAT